MLAQSYCLGYTINCNKLLQRNQPVTIDRKIVLMTIRDHGTRGVGRYPYFIADRNPNPTFNGGISYESFRYWRVWLDRLCRRS